MTDIDEDENGRPGEIQRDGWMRLKGGWGPKTYNFQMRIDQGTIADQYIYRQFIEGIGYELEITWPLLRALNPGDLFVDVGANIGYFTLLAAQLVGSWGHVLAFEPGIEARSALRANIAENGFDNITVIDRPAFREVAEVTFWNNHEASAGSALYDAEMLAPNKGNRITPLTMMATTIDAEVERLAPNGRPVVIKIDVEGAEQQVLEGAVRTIARRRPKLVFAEFHPVGLGHMGGSLLGMRQFMAGLGYWTWILRPDDAVPTYLPPGTDVNFLDVPPHVVATLNMLFATPRTVEEFWPMLALKVG